MEIQKEVFHKLTRKEETKYGYRLFFENESAPLRTIKKFIEAEQKCCPFFQFELTENENNQEIVLSMDVPESVRDLE